MREDTEDSDELDSVIWDTDSETDDQSDEDGWIFSEDADWLLPELQ